jgi:ABC-type uncharacterized transport system fused permease/ATPase subunit
MMGPETNYSSNPKSYTTEIVATIISLIAYGFTRILFESIFDYIHVNHEYAGDATLLFYIVAYAVTKTIYSRNLGKESSERQQYKGLFRIAGVLLLAGLILTIMWHLLRYDLTIY